MGAWTNYDWRNFYGQQLFDTNTACAANCRATCCR